MRTVRRQNVSEFVLVLVRANPLESARKSRDNESAFMVKHPPSGGDHAWDHENGPTNRKNAQNL